MVSEIHGHTDIIITSNNFFFLYYNRIQFNKYVIHKSNQKKKKIIDTKIYLRNNLNDQMFLLR